MSKEVYAYILGNLIAYSLFDEVIRHINVCFHSHVHGAPLTIYYRYCLSHKMADHTPVHTLRQRPGKRLFFFLTVGSISVKYRAL